MKGSRYSETELIAMIRMGGSQREDAVRQLLTREQREKKLRTHLLKLGAAQEECDEIVDDALVALISSVEKGRFETGRSIWAYLYGASRNILYKLNRSKNPTLSLEENYPIDAGEEPVGVEIIRGERKVWLLSIFNKLSEKCQDILRMAFFEERTNQEITEQMNYKSKAVTGVKKSECLKALALLFKDHPSFD